MYIRAHTSPIYVHPCAHICAYVYMQLTTTIFMFDLCPSVSPIKVGLLKGKDLGLYIFMVVYIQAKEYGRSSKSDC